MEFVKSSYSSVKFYSVLILGTALIVFGTKISAHKLWGEQAANAVTLALSIILQALPFILLGVLASSLIRLLLREQWVARVSPRNGVMGVITGALLGLCFPVCDCGVMPVARSLLNKGVSRYTVFAYLLTAPVINPVVILATALAFQWNWGLVFLRVLGTFGIGTITAFLIGSFFRDGDLGPIQSFSGRRCSEKSIYAAEHVHVQAEHPVRDLFRHTADEFFDIGGYLILSAFLAAAIQVWVPKGALFQYIGNPYLAIAAMMILAISMSLCSEADAFVARALANQFPLGSVLAFLTIGQILDLRNIVLFAKNFRLSLCLTLAVLSFALTFFWGLSIDLGLLRLPGF